jgi:carbon-monoxide dehydrogenase iron sulfur subunit
VVQTIKLNSKLCLACNTCQLACILARAKKRNINELIFDTHIPLPRLRIILKANKLTLQKCIHCKKPKCMDACKHEAIYKTDDGFVLIEFEKCEACWECIEACPFDSIRKHEELNRPIKCDMCLPVGGKPTGGQACVEACPTGALCYVEAKR